MRLGWLEQSRSICDADLFCSKLVGLYINCEKPSNVVKLYYSKPHRLLAPSFHQLAHFAFRYPIIKLHKRDYNAMLEQMCSNLERKLSVSSAV